VRGRNKLVPGGKRFVPTRRKEAETSVPATAARKAGNLDEADNPAHHPAKITREGAVERGFMAER